MSTVRMQGRRRLGELARVCGGATHPQTVASIKKTPRTGRGGWFGQMTFSGSVGHCGDSGQPGCSGTSVSS